MPNARRYVRRALRARAAETGATGELNIVPFLDIVTNLMLFLLATSASVLAVSEVRAELPAFGPRGPARGLDLSVTLTDRGAVMAGGGGRLGPDCRPSSSALPTAARTATGFDFAALARCAREVHDTYPTETQVILSADPDISYADFIRAMDALRADGDALLFPDVRVSAGVR